ncbi:protein of unknown function [Lentzea waywayandensis]|uniref:DUF4253 domain-containing protein n=1 Tax=Lentzea waywayandensis TaxID=84724 RepID=A0A1I6FHZ7_9PSEU|nr:DUF4253 domain-containing protein [Lentzea waywayandensis]SFR29565.1 protein of unknown function [Lentzea waywayandensis]
MSLEDRLAGLALPPGHVVHGDGASALWVSHGPATPGLWSSIAGQKPGLWPLVLGQDGPWDSGELISAASGEHDPAILLPKWWYEYVDEDEDDDVTAPFGRDWPGFAPALPDGGDPGGAAFGLVASLLGGDPRMRLGLVAADRGADALGEMGWSGPANYVGDMGEVVAVIRDWEERFGARVVGLRGHDTVHLSVASPPRTKQDALLVAAEHFALCPDNIWSRSDAPTLDSYASRLVGLDSWEFWWD